ncbi:hypothetical protein GGI07_005626 [Coemansia sp. Benny D115]|nr:hypothetical protein GGI07_005626 [Coemansia sp. Benny D115]
MSLPGLSVGYLKPSLPQLGGQRRRKNPLVPSKDQVDTNSEVIFPGPFNSAYSTVDTIPLDQAVADYRQVLLEIKDSKKNSIVVGMKNTDAAHNGADADDVEVVPGSPGSSSYNSDD